MDRLDVYSGLGRDRRSDVPDVQAGLLAILAIRTVVLLPKCYSQRLVRNLNPIFTIRGEQLVMVAQTIATILTKELEQAVAS